MPVRRLRIQGTKVRVDPDEWNVRALVLKDQRRSWLQANAPTHEEAMDKLEKIIEEYEREQEDLPF